MPFTEVNKLIEAQLKGKTFPEDKSGPVEVTVQRATVAASGDRLLITLRVKAKEKKSWFGLGAEATVHVWGKPVLDRAQQVLRLTDIALDVSRRQPSGCSARRRARPSLSQGRARRECAHRPQAVRRQCAQEHRGGDRGFPPERQQGVQVDAAVTDLRLVGIEYDAKTLRVIAEADGSVKVAISALPQ